MEDTAMQKILDAEKKADEIISEGIRKSREISERSAHELRELTAQFEENLEKEVSAIIKGHVDEANVESKELENSFLVECEEIRKEASPRIEKAVSYVIGKMGDGKWQ